MLGEGLACGVTLMVRMQAREGEFHGLSSTAFCPPGTGRECAGGPKFYRAQDDITADSAILKIF
jgi:hypothetical protein